MKKERKRKEKRKKRERKRKEKGKEKERKRKDGHTRGGWSLCCTFYRTFYSFGVR